MTGFLGMDIDAVQRQLNHLEHDAIGAVAAVLSAMPGLMQEIQAHWKGPDAERFVQEWETHISGLHLLQRALNDMAGELSGAITAQRNTSSH